MKLFKSEICCEERRTFRLHLSYSIIEGFILGILALNEFVFIKSLLGSNYQLSILFQFSMLVFLLLVFANEFLKRIKKRRKFLLWVGLATRLPLLLLAFFPRDPAAYQGDSIYHYLFLAIFLNFYLAATVINPTINLLLKTNYSHKNFGTFYSYSQSANKIIVMVVTFLYGLLLDYDNYAFTRVFPVVALLGVLSIYLLSQINYTPPEITAIKTSFLQSVAKSVKNMMDVLVKNRAYFHFEMGFMLYGFAFMTTYPVITIYFYDALELNYSSVAFYRNSYNIIAVLMLPVFGRLLGKSDPRKFSLLTYASLAAYLFFLILTGYLPFYTDIAGIKIYYTLIFYMIFHGVFAATMVLLWNIGSAYFGRDDEADLYQSTHLFLTGARAVFAPLTGIYIFQRFGFDAAFGVGIAVLIVAMIYMFYSYRNHQKL